MPRVSFEFFPPKTAAMEASLWQAIKQLAPFHPSFVSVTYGAGGSTRERTHATVARIRRETTLEPAAHLTCVGASRDEIDAVAQGYWDAGIRHVVALRGDPPAGAGPYQPHPAGYARAADLVAGLKRVADFEISVAAYPEVHPEALSAAADLDNLKRKIDAGARRAITQFFFDAAPFLRFRDRAAAMGIAVPIVPGILPIVDFAQAKKFAAMCGAAVPTWLEAEFAAAGDEAQARAAASERVAVAHCRRLIAAGVEALHFYTLNRAALVAAICGALGIGVAVRPAVAIAE
ncbi:MAG TPA: methylenetetrahydrofolate reductase [NAD(P)H] [Stellaceae bacterium]|nr:methylenetetrahydrofolate reductase [NAD(P)H] [Stellaceae bacterium]